jgi:hypothetical protein
LSFAQRRLEFAIKLAANPGTNQPNVFADTQSDTVTVSGLRASARIHNNGAAAGSQAEIKVYGLKPSLMNQLATLGMVFNIVPRNTITVSAGDLGAQLATVYSGVILSANADYNLAPDVPLVLTCQSGLADATAPALASSYRGPVDVATVMSGFARQMGVGFENSGVSVKLPGSYFPGTVRQQVAKCARDANIDWDIVQGNSGPVLAIWPRGGSRSTPAPTMIAAPPSGGMIGYPAFTPQGILVHTVFDPNLSRGSLVQVESSILQAGTLTRLNSSGTWAVNKLDLALDAQIPKGEWKSSLYCYNPRYPQPVPPQA